VRLGRKSLVTAAVVTVIGGSLAAGAMSSNESPPRECDDGATIYMYPEAEAGSLSLPDC
jgi:hypothetical protein